MHLREERHRGTGAPRNQSSSREGSGLGGLLTSSPMLTAARASMAVSSGSGAAVATTPEGAAPPHLHPQRTWTHPPMLIEHHSYLQMAHRMKCWAPRGTDQRNHPGTGRDVRCVRSKRSVGGRARREALTVPQISQSVSRRSSARAREISTGGGRGCQSFIKERRDRSEIMLIRPQQTHEVIHERSFSVSAAQTLKTTIVPSSADRKRPQPEGHDETASWKRRVVRDLLHIENCSLSWSAQGNRWWGTPWSHPLRPTGTKQRWTGLCGDQHSSHPLGSEAKKSMTVGNKASDSERSN